MQIIHTKDYVPACTSNLCGFTFNTRGPTSALMEHCERLEINMCCHTTESSRDFRTFRFARRYNLLTWFGWKVSTPVTAMAPSWFLCMICRRGGGGNCLLMWNELCPKDDLSRVKARSLMCSCFLKRYTRDKTVTTNQNPPFHLGPLFLRDEITTISLCHSAYVTVVLGTWLL